MFVPEKLREEQGNKLEIAGNMGFGVGSEEEQCLPASSGHDGQRGYGSRAALQIISAAPTLQPIYLLYII
jgi:hypothetical protein